MLYTDEEIKRRRKRDQKVKRTINTIAYIILIPLLLYNISLIIQAIIKPDKTPSFLGIKTYVIISGSMQPELQIGDIVIAKNVPIEELQVGDIISFRRGQLVITHRISEILVLEDGKKQFRTKGDFNNVEDTELINETQIEGKVVNCISHVGKALLLLKNKTIIILIVVFYYIYLLHSQSMQKKRKRREMKRTQYEKRKNEEK